MQRPLLSLFCLLVICIMLTSCGERAKVRKLITDFMKSEIVIPENLYVIEEKMYHEADKSALKDLKLVMYIDSSSCGSCRIARFWEMIPLYELSESDSRFSVMAIFSPTIDELPEMERQLMALDFPYPVYVDIYREFALHNRIPADSRFHDFLIDADGTILFVGNPLGTDRLMTVFNKTLNNFKQ